MPRSTTFPPRSRRRSALIALSAVALTVSFVACTPSGEHSAPERPDPSRTAGVDPTGAPDQEAPSFHPRGTAEDNLPLFAAITEQVWAGKQHASGRAYIDALVAAGFDKTAMQITPDATTVGRPVESMQFAVRWGEVECLVGQVGPSTGEPVTAIMDQLAEGRCLVGSTQAIDW